MTPLTPDQAALVEANMGLVPWVLKRRHTPQYAWDDAHQDGMLGLIRAAQKFDVGLGWTFGTYAVQWISSMVQKGAGDVNDRSAVRASRERPERPLSLDHPAEMHAGHGAGFEEDLPLSALLADEGVEVERDALMSAEHGDLVAKLIEACADPIDLAIVEVACGPLFSRRSLARDLLISVDEVIARIEQIRARVLAEHGTPAMAASGCTCSGCRLALSIDRKRQSLNRKARRVAA